MTVPNPLDCPRAYPQTGTRARIRQSPADFQVDEILGFEPDQGGEHVCLLIRKQNTNTAWLAEQLAALAGVRQVDVSYAGLKDRLAVTTQWFSVRLPSRTEPDWHQLDNEQIQILKITRHHRKLKRGCLQGNRFTITLRDFDMETSQFQQRLSLIRQQGVPNYFGEQRFGHQNLQQAAQMFNGQLRVKSKNKRSLYLSAARSEIFNALLAQRVQDHSWHLGLDGDVMNLDGSQSFFTTEQLDDTLRDRLQQQDIHPTGPLWGQGELRSSLQAAKQEYSVAQHYPDLCRGLEQAGLKQQRRPLRLTVHDLEGEQQPNRATLRFSLPAGCYATVVLRELTEYDTDG